MNVSAQDYQPAKLRDQVRQVFADHFQAESVPRVETPDVRRLPRADGIARWNEAFLSNWHLHDPDYVVFKHFKDPSSHIIDIGAHFGYSAASMWRAGCKAKVFSFEPNPAYVSCLTSLKQVRPGQYDFKSVGLGDTRSSGEFVIPVLNNVLMGAFCSLETEPDIDRLVEHVIEHFERYHRVEGFRSFRLHVFRAEMAPLDELFPAVAAQAGIHHVAAMKVDVEGWELPVLKGAEQFLRSQWPLVMTECGPGHQGVIERLLALGYQTVERRDSVLVMTGEPRHSLNQFFCHTTRCEEYKRMGLLADS